MIRKRQIIPVNIKACLLLVVIVATAAATMLITGCTRESLSVEEPSGELATEVTTTASVKNNELPTVVINFNDGAEPTAEATVPEETIPDETTTISGTGDAADEETTTPEETTIPEETTTAEPEPSVLDGYLLADVKRYLNVRKEADIESEVVGKLYVGDLAVIVEEIEGWTHITSGNVDGYVSTEYTVTGKAAEEYIIEEGMYVAKTTASGLRIRKEPNTECEYYSSAYKGQTFAALGEAKDGWVPIRYQMSECPDGVAYLSAEYVELSCDLGEAITIEEEKEQIRLAEEAKKKAEEEARIKRILDACKVVPVANREPFSFSDEDVYLLACLVYTEAGVEPYEGKLAVANVVLNRYLQGYGDTLTEIIYAKNQFSPASSGSLARCLEKGPTESCVRAAKEAVAGVNNIGDYCHFITISRANYEKYTEYTIINRHCFYKRKGWG